MNSLRRTKIDQKENECPGDANGIFSRIYFQSFPLFVSAVSANTRERGRNHSRANERILIPTKRTKRNAEAANDSASILLRAENSGNVKSAAK